MLLIDSHEPADIVQALQAKMPVKVLVLKYGDYSFSDVIIERKTLSDFFLSLKKKIRIPNGKHKQALHP